MLISEHYTTKREFLEKNEIVEDEIKSKDKFKAFWNGLPSEKYERIYKENILKG